MAGERALKLLIAGDASGALKALGQTGDATDGLGAKLAKFGKWAAAGFAAAGVAAAAFGKAAVEAAAESQKISKVTDQLIKSTGGAAKISADEVGKLATALSNKTGIDDEAIQSAQNLILTFKNVRNEVGKGNDIFNRASALALDLSTVMGGDASSAAMQLAKALDNPIKGVTALTRSGVSFTAQQKEQIKALVESGKTLEAQKIILKEVESQVGGAAAAAATDAERAKVAFGNLQEQIGMYLLPVVEKVSNYLVTTFIPKLSELADKYGPAVGAAFQRLGEIMKVVWGWLQVNVPPIIETVRTVVQNVLEGIRQFWDRWGAGITTVATVWFNAVKGQIEGIMRSIRGVIEIVLGLIDGDWKRVWEGIKTFVSGIGHSLGALIRGWSDLLKIAAEVAFKAMKEGVVLGAQSTISWIKAMPTMIGMLLFDLPAKMGEIGRDIIGGIWSGIVSKTKEFAGNLRGWIDRNIPSAVKLLLGIRSPSRVMADIGNNIGDGLIVGMTEKSDAVSTAAVAMVGSVTGPMAGEAARNGGRQLAQTIFAAMASEAARNGTTVYTPLIASMAGEAARNGNKVAKPLFAAMAGEAARNGADQISVALRDKLEQQARDLGYDMGKAMADSITEQIENVEIYAKGFFDKLDVNYGTKIGPTAQAAARSTTNLSLAELYARAGGGDAAWWASQMANLVDWNAKVGNTAVQVRPFAPSVGGTLLTDKAGNPIYADEVDKITEALNALIPAMGSGGIVTAPTLAMIGEAGPEAIIPLGSSMLAGNEVVVNVYGSVTSERDLVDTIRKALVREQQQGKILIPS